MISTSDGIGLDVRSIGSGASVVFVHEYSGDARSWDLQIGFFSRYYRCTAYCARGYQPSHVPTAAEAYDHVRAADDIAEVVRAVADGPAHVVGLAMGGLAALHFGLCYPELVRSLVIASVGSGTKPDDHPEYGSSLRAEADHAEAIGMTAYARELAGRSFARCLRGKDEAGWHRFAEQLSEHSVTGMAMTLRGVLSSQPSLWHLADVLSELAAPILLVVGDEDTPCFEPNLFLKATLPDAGLSVLPRTGHLVNLEEPGLFNAIVFAFLAAVDGGRWTKWKGDLFPRLNPFPRVT